MHQFDSIVVDVSEWTMTSDVKGEPIHDPLGVFTLYTSDSEGLNLEAFVNDRALNVERLMRIQ